ncbi:DUF6086 family protein [Streptomyces sp. NBC_00343]|uniref:DUF6086 family protein n=1 Tax=Streptomyces sp. NBC_00343 TaxID=2975719 RepID=UPI002E2D3C08|nr:DUF6086 family protein [Streptomyces sp. NBC_00343]
MPTTHRNFRSNGTGRLFLRGLQVFEAELNLLSGIGQGRHWADPGTLEVDSAAYAEFVHALVAWHCRTGHSVIFALSEGGTEVEIPEPEADHVGGRVQRDVQVPGNPRTTSATVVVTGLDTRAREMDRSMAR